jgi:hypothetical protein
VEQVHAVDLVEHLHLEELEVVQTALLVVQVVKL